MSASYTETKKKALENNMKLNEFPLQVVCLHSAVKALSCLCPGCQHLSFFPRPLWLLSSHRRFTVQNLISLRRGMRVPHRAAPLGQPGSGSPRLLAQKPLLLSTQRPSFIRDEIGVGCDLCRNTLQRCHAHSSYIWRVSRESKCHG